jgi:hypothetical protein
MYALPVVVDAQTIPLAGSVASDLPRFSPKTVLVTAETIDAAHEPLIGVLTARRHETRASNGIRRRSELVWCATQNGTYRREILARCEARGGGMLTEQHGDDEERSSKRGKR